MIVFQLTPPMWVATTVADKSTYESVISTHTTHVGGDGKSTSTNQNAVISTHTTHVGGDSNFRQKHIRNCILHPPKFTKNFKAASILILFYHNIFIN